MSESAGAATLAIALAFIGFVLIVMGVRGTYPEVWTVITSAAPATTQSNSSNGSNSTAGGKSTVK